MTDEPRTRRSLIESMKDRENEVAWDRFVDLYKPRLLEWASQMGFSEADANDAAADITTKLVRHIDKFEYDSKKTFRGYLRRMLQSWASDEHRRRNRTEKVVELRDDDQVHLSKRNESLLDELCSVESKALKIVAIREVLRSIDQADRSLWIAMNTDSVPIETVMEDFGISSATAYRRKNKISKMMSDQFEAWTSGD